MVTNFYIMPSVQKLMVKRYFILVFLYYLCETMIIFMFRKSIEQMIAKTKDNWAEAIATRRDAQSKLKLVQDSLKMIENMIIQKSEDNNEKIVILQSLLEDPFCKQDIEELLASQAKCESDHMLSKQELTSASLTLDPLLGIEDFVCCLSLKNNNNGTKFNIKALENKTLSFSNKSPQGPVMGLFQSILSFLLVQMREENLWKEDGTQDGSEQAQACATNLMNGNSISIQEKLLPAFINYYDNDTSSEEISTTGSENSSGDGHQMCYMQFRINNTIQPKVVFRLNFDEAPMMSRRFMNYCTGFSGLSYKECSIFMVN
jgi:arsenate reductase-like glutaredoxin family protein